MLRKLLSVDPDLHKAKPAGRSTSQRTRTAVLIRVPQQVRKWSVFAAFPAQIHVFESETRASGLCVGRGGGFGALESSSGVSGPLPRRRLWVHFGEEHHRGRA